MMQCNHPADATFLQVVHQLHFDKELDKQSAPIYAGSTIDSIFEST